jgi:6-phosphofructokinase
LGTLDAITYYGTTENAQTIQTKESVQGLFRASAKELTADVEAQFAVRDRIIKEQGSFIKSLTERICKLEK